MSGFIRSCLIYYYKRKNKKSTYFGLEYGKLLVSLFPHHKFKYWMNSDRIFELGIMELPDDSMSFLEKVRVAKTALACNDVLPSVILIQQNTWLDDWWLDGKLRVIPHIYMKVLNEEINDVLDLIPKHQDPDHARLRCEDILRTWEKLTLRLIEEV